MSNKPVKLVSTGTQIVCFDASQLIYVSNHQRSGQTFSGRMLDVVEIDSALFALTDQNSIYKIQNDIVDLPFQLPIEKLPIEHILRVGKQLFIFSQSKFYLFD